MPHLICAVDRGPVQTDGRGSGGDGARGPVGRAVQQLEDDALAEPALADLERLAEQLRKLLEQQHAGGQDANAPRIELEALGDLAGSGRRSGPGSPAPGSRTRAPRRRGCGATWRCRRRPPPGPAARTRLPRRSPRCGRAPPESPPATAGRWRGSRRRGSPEPILNDWTERSPSVTLPTTTSEEPPPTSTTADLALDRVAQGLGRADERQATLLVLAQHLDLDARDAGDLGHDLGAVGRLADRRRGHGADRLGAHLLGEPDLGGDHLGDLGDLVGVDRPVVLRGLADPRVGALLHHLAKLALLRLGDEHAGGVRADVDRRAEHAVAILSDGTDAAHAWRSAAGNGPFTCGSRPLHGGLAAGRRNSARMRANWPADRLGLNVPNDWWAAPALLKSFEAAGFARVQVHAPPPSVLSDPRQCMPHATALAAALATTGARCRSSMPRPTSGWELAMPTARRRACSPTRPRSAPLTSSTTPAPCRTPRRARTRCCSRPARLPLCRCAPSGLASRSRSRTWRRSSPGPSRCRRARWSSVVSSTGSARSESGSASTSATPTSSPSFAEPRSRP